MMLAGLLVMMCGQGPEFDNPEHGAVNFWKDVKFIPDSTGTAGKRGQWTGWFHQDVVDAAQLDKGIIRARVEGKWQEFKTVELPEGFIKWNFGRRLEQLADMKQMMITKQMKMPEVAGPHSGMVASHGTKRKDSYFAINNAVKGIGWLPKPNKIPEVIELMKQTWDYQPIRKLAVLESLYRRGTELVDLTKQTSLELYSRPNFETHTFLNQMADPGVSVVFLDLPKSYELRCIAQMLHPDDPELTDYEQQVVDYINLSHDYFHGHAPQKSIAVIYHVVQVFDNSPPMGRGRRVVPSLP